jgi:hypothetical protein
MYSFVCASARFFGLMRGLVSSAAAMNAWTSLQKELERNFISPSLLIVVK